MVPTGTEPNWIEDGETAIAAGEGVVGWLERLFDAPVSPVQPDPPKTIKVVSSRLAEETAFACRKFDWDEHFPGPRVRFRAAPPISELSVRTDGHSTVLAYRLRTGETPGQISTRPVGRRKRTRRPTELLSSPSGAFR